MSIIEEFRNNVFCRRKSNQIKANKLWLKVSGNLSNSDKTLFEIEWSHYMIGELEPNEFSFYFTNHVKKYFN
jgi:hypothetical protein